MNTAVLRKLLKRLDRVALCPPYVQPCCTCGSLPVAKKSDGLLVVSCPTADCEDTTICFSLTPTVAQRSFEDREYELHCTWWRAWNKMNADRSQNEIAIEREDAEFQRSLATGEFGDELFGRRK